MVPLRVPEHRSLELAKLASDAPSWLVSSRRWVASLGLVAIGVVAVLGDVTAANTFGIVVLLALGIAAGVGWIEVFAIPRTRESTDKQPVSPSQAWLPALVAMAFVAALAAQSWFHAGTVIAG